MYDFKSKKLAIHPVVPSAPPRILSGFGGVQGGPQGFTILVSSLGQVSGASEADSFSHASRDV